MTKLLTIVLLVALSWVTGRFILYEPLSQKYFGREANLERPVIVNTPAGQMKVVVDLAKITPEELNRHVRLRKALIQALGADSEGEPVELKEGSKVKVVSIEGENLRVTRADDGKGEQFLVPVDDTNFVASVTRARFRKFMESKESQEGGAFGEKVASTPAETAGVAVVEVEEKEEDVQQVTPAERVIVKQAADEAKEAPAPPKTRDENIPLTNDEIVTLMKKHVEENPLQSFTLESVKQWSTGEEQVSGKTYQAGYAYYEGETVFGIRSARAVALFEKGRLLRWMNPITGTQMD